MDAWDNGKGSMLRIGPRRRLSKALKSGYMDRRWLEMLQNSRVDGRNLKSFD